MNDTGTWGPRLALKDKVTKPNREEEILQYHDMLTGFTICFTIHDCFTFHECFNEWGSHTGPTVHRLGNQDAHRIPLGPPSAMPSVMDAEVIIIGAGVSGAGSAYHLANAGCKDVLVLESGKIGLGYEGGSGLGEEAEPRYSGTAVMASPANTIKMVIQLYACSSAEYVRLNGKEGAQAYLRSASSQTQDQTWKQTK